MVLTATRAPVAVTPPLPARSRLAFSFLCPADAIRRSVAEPDADDAGLIPAMGERLVERSLWAGDALSLRWRIVGERVLRGGWLGDFDALRFAA